MKITSIAICNFGIYKGNNQYDLNVSGNKNVVLINGNNGAGKTTLLNAFKIGLYGALVFGYQTNNANYLSYIKNKYNEFAKVEGDSDFFITIGIEYLDKGKTSQLSIKRYWREINGHFNEELELTKNQVKMDYKQSQYEIKRFYELMPLSFLDMFFFDGEKIESLLNKTHGFEYINEMINKIMNIDLFYKLENDLVKYIKQKNVFSHLSEVEQEYELETTRLTETQNKLSQFKSELAKISEHKSNMEIELKLCEADFKKLGGLSSDDISNLNELIRNQTSLKTNLSNSQRILVTEKLPLILLKKQINKLNESLKHETHSKQNTILKSMLENETLITLLDQDSTINTQNMMNHFDFVFQYKSNNKLLFDATVIDVLKIDEMTHESNNLNVQSILDNYNKLSIINTEISTLKETLNISLDEEFSNYAERLSGIQKDLSNTESQIEIYKRNIDEHSLLEEQLFEKIKQLFSAIKMISKDGNVSTLVHDIKLVIDSYTQHIRHIKFVEFEKYITDIFKQLIRKEDFIQRISIDHESDRIELFNILGNNLPEENLSAGERQIFVLALLYGMLKLSKRDIPLIFDTLLGRLDKSHKANIINNFISHSSEQVIILATDSEIDDEYYDLLKPMISKHYQLEFDSNEHVVIIKENLYVV